MNKFLSWCHAKPQCKRQELQDLLTIPMQRMTKYPLLLQVIQKTFDNNNTDTR